MFSIKISELVKSGEVIIKTGPFGTQLKASEYVKMGTPVLNVKNLGYGRVVDEKLDMVGNDTVERLSAHLLRTGDIVFGRKGAVERHAFISQNEKGWMQGSDCIRLRVNSSRINPKYLSYYFLTDKHKAFMMGMCSHGTTMASLNQKIIEQIEVSLPSIDVQNKIVALLGSIDEKVKINEKINDNLEQQATALYAEMFLNSSNNDVTPGTLSDIAVITMGQSPSGSSYNEDGVGEVFYQGRAEFGFRFPKRRLFTTEPKRMAEDGDVLLSVRAPVGDLNVAYERCCIGRGLGAIHSKTGHSSFVLYTMFALRSQLDVFNGEGTVFGSINRDALNAIQIGLPHSTQIDLFESAAHPIDDLIRTNYEENCRLETIRDVLLPKLMSGEIDASAIQL